MDAAQPHAASRSSEWSMVAFRGGPAGGNPAGVVLDPPPMDDASMTRTAVRLNPVSETAFVGAPANGVFPLRYFAPGGEVPLCGHATAAAFGALALAGRLGPLPAVARSAAPGGNVTGRVEREGDDVVVWMDMPVATRVESALDLEAVAGALGLPHAVLASRPAAAIEDVGIRIALLPVADLAALDAMRPSFDRLRALGRPDRITVFYVFAFDPESRRVRARSFAPAVDIDEDPATGTAAAALGAYLAREGLVEGETEIRIRQGELMGRPSDLRLTIQHDDRVPRAIRVGGIVAGEPAGVVEPG